MLGAWGRWRAVVCVSAAMRHRPEWEATPALRPWVAALMMVVGTWSAVVVVVVGGVVHVLEEWMGRTLLLQRLDEVPEGSLVVVAY